VPTQISAAVDGGRRGGAVAGTLNHHQNYNFFNLKVILSPFKPVSKPQNFKSLTKSPDRRKKWWRKSLFFLVLFHSVLLFLSFSFSISGCVCGFVCV
jgi:hypothetical protein